MRGRVLIDLRNIYERDAVEKAGFIITVWGDSLMNLVTIAILLAKILMR